jgi:adenylylsulfate kinase
MTEQKAENITWHEALIHTSDREKLLKQKGVVLWFTGLPSSGKSTLAHCLEEKLYNAGHLTYVLDGDNIRHGLNKNLGFSPQDREENIRRIGHVAQLFADAGVIAMTAFISPYRSDREKARALLPAGSFIEIYVQVSLQVAETRDVKGLYKKARLGEIKEFTGVSAPYEEPEHAELVIDTNSLSVEAGADLIISYLREHGIIR